MSDYFNYGFNETTFKHYSESIKSKLPDLKYKIDNNHIRDLINDKSLKEYLFSSFPADYGGIGDILNVNQYSNVRLFEANAQEGRTIPTLEHQQGRFLYPLDKSLTNDIMMANNNANGHMNGMFRPPFMPIIPPWGYQGYKQAEEDYSYSSSEERKKKKKKEKKHKKDKKSKNKRSRSRTKSSRSKSHKNRKTDKSDSRQRNDRKNKRKEIENENDLRSRNYKSEKKIH